MTFIEKIESILPEIDIETGIMYCGDDEELLVCRGGDDSFY